MVEGKHGVIRRDDVVEAEGDSRRRRRAGRRSTAKTVTLPNDVVFAMIGREAPLDFFRRSGIPIRGEWRPLTYVTLRGVVPASACSSTPGRAAPSSTNTSISNKLFPFGLPSLGGSSLGKALTEAVRQPSFYYTLAYTTAIWLFGYKRIKRRNTPYITRQTLTLMAVQMVPLFLLPYIVLPWMGHAGVFSRGLARRIADNLFPEQSWWRAFGFILAWPLFVWNLFNWKPLQLVAGHRPDPDLRADSADRSPLGQGRLLRLDLLLRRAGGDVGRHAAPEDAARPQVESRQLRRPGHPRRGRSCYSARESSSGIGRIPVSAITCRRSTTPPSTRTPLYDYYHVVDIFLAGVVGVAMYFWFSGRVWCRFACPLAALMNIYSRAFTQIPYLCREKEMHFLQRLHLRLSPGHRHHELCQQGAAHGRSPSACAARPACRAAPPARSPSVISERTASRCTTSTKPRRCRLPRTARSTCACSLRNVWSRSRAECG